MPRPRLSRRVCVRPEATYFKPRGIPLRQLQRVQLSREELEVLWLLDEKGNEQTWVARHMRTSQSTVQRLATTARKKVAHALIHGKAIVLDLYE